MGTEEVWRDVVGYEGYYKVNNYGMVVSRWRQGCKENQRLKPIQSKFGYIRYVLYANGTRRDFSAHRIVAMAFLGFNPAINGIEIDHINGCKTDNRVENLRIIDHRANCSAFRRDFDKLTSRYTGVSFNKKSKKWEAKIYHNGKSKYLGEFINEFDAANAYQNALISINLT